MLSLKHALIFILISSFSLCFGTAAQAAGNPQAYKLTIKSIDLKDNKGDWITVATPNQVLDIASVAQNSAAGSISVDIPQGRYVNFRLTLSETITFSGSDGTAYTKQGGVITIKGDSASDGSTATWTEDPPLTNDTTESQETYTASAAEQGEVTQVCDLANGGDSDDTMTLYSKTDWATPVHVKKNSKISMFFDFDTQNTVHHAAAGPNDIMYILPPQEGSEFGITVDGETYSITAANMRIDF